MNGGAIELCLITWTALRSGFMTATDASHVL